jgi:hypothetical protein
VERKGQDIIPYGKWLDRYTEWLRDLGFLDKLGGGKADTL